jgi:hypothetical protein
MVASFLFLCIIIAIAFGLPAETSDNQQLDNQYGGRKRMNQSSSTIVCQPIHELNQLVKARHTRSIMYIITHNNESDHVAQAYIDCYGAHDWMFIARSPTNVYFESLVYLKFFPKMKNQWQHYDYVITATYKTLTRHLMPKILPFQSFQNIVDLLKVAKQSQYDVIPFLRQNESMIKIATKYHKQEFHDAWFSLLSKLGYNHSTIILNSDVKGFYRNVFIIKPTFLLQLCDFMTKAVKLTEESPYLQDLLRKDAHYVMGKVEVAKKVFGTRYYQLYPFVFERLPIFYLNMAKARLCLHDHGPCKYNYKG